MVDVEVVEVAVFWGDVGEGRAIQRFNGVRISIAHTLVCVASVVEKAWCTIFMRGGVEWSTQMSKVDSTSYPLNIKYLVHRCTPQYIKDPSNFTSSQHPSETRTSPLPL
jgi:hypothetical protein